MNWFRRKPKPPKHVHEWGMWTEAKNAQNMTIGQVRRCSTCGYLEGERL